MKKLFSTMLAAVIALAALATDYTGTLTVDGSSSQATVTVNNSGSDYTLIINNIVDWGTIEITAPGTTSNGLTSVVASQDIEAGTANLVLAFNDYAMTFKLNIIADYGIVNVQFAQDGELTGYQIKNSGFENFKDNGEPFAWHGFKSATGTWAGMAPGSLASSGDCHSGSKSVVATSGSAFFKVGNGTFTTGRLNAGSTTPENTSNCSKMDISDTNLDANNDPYYTIMHGRPDTFKFWVKFVPKSSSSQASMSAIITDGTYYQDPEDKTYTNKLATAKNTTIASNSTWTEISVPFSYIDESITGQALLVTFSTNATPGGGASGDAIYVDDIALVYNAAITGISIKDVALAGFSQDVYEYNFDLAEGETIAESDIAATYVSSHAYLVKKVVETRDGYKLFVAVVSNDLNTVKVYTINYLKPASSLSEILENGVDEQEYTVADELAIADGFGITVDDSKIVGATDGNGNYISLIVPTDFSETSIAAKGLTGIYTIENGNPAITASGNITAGSDAFAYEIETFNLSLIDQNGFDVKPSQVIYLKGYGDADGKLRSYRNAPQGTSIVLNNLSGITIQPGYLYKMYGMMTLNEAWETESQGIMPKIAPTDPRWFDNYTFVATSGQETVITGIDDININGRQIEAIYNAQGQRVNENATGILIIRYTDGTVTKIVK